MNRVYGCLDERNGERNVQNSAEVTARPSLCERANTDVAQADSDADALPTEAAASKKLRKSLETEGVCHGK